MGYLEKTLKSSPQSDHIVNRGEIYHRVTQDLFTRGKKKVQSEAHKANVLIKKSFGWFFNCG